jgi:AbrB family looped-hinge helix DNA binding protein
MNMPKTKVTSKFQVTIPKEVREKVGIRAGEVVIVESVSDEEIVVRRFRRVKDPLRILIGKTPSLRHVPVEELEEKAEMR